MIEGLEVKGHCLDALDTLDHLDTLVVRTYTERK